MPNLDGVARFSKHHLAYKTIVVLIRPILPNEFSSALQPMNESSVAYEFMVGHNAVDALRKVFRDFQQAR